MRQLKTQSEALLNKSTQLEEQLCLSHAENKKLVDLESLGTRDQAEGVWTPQRAQHCSLLQWSSVNRIQVDKANQYT
jgi:hypothetical protein